MISSPYFSNSKNSKSHNSSQSGLKYSLFLSLGLGGLLATNFLSSECEGENHPGDGNNENYSDPPEKHPELSQTQQIYESLGTSTFQLHKMMEQDQLTMKRELEDATEEELSRLDRMSDSQIESVGGFEDREEEIVRQGGLMFRKLTVLEEGMLKNGMKVQINVCQPDNPNVFLPMNKVLIFNREGKYYCTGSFCGYDFTDLNDGIYIGDKIICPTCSSTYNITNGLVDQGPTLRNLSSFPMSVRKKKVKLVVPDQIPAFSLRETLAREEIDPRTYIVIGDSEAALSAIITLRYSFTGRIIVLPTSASGAFENKDIFSRKFGPLNKSEVYLVEPDLFRKAQVDVISAGIQKIDHDTRTVHFTNNESVEFEGILFAGSSNKEVTSKFTNVYTISDFETHAKVHNEVIKAKHVCVLGGTFEAYQSAMAIRDYLDQLGLKNIKITLIERDSDEFVKTLGRAVSNKILNEFKKRKISVIRNAEILKIDGDHKLNAIYFKYPKFEREYFISPDVCINEGPLQKVDHKYHDKIFFDKPKYRPELDHNGAFKIDKRFSIMLHLNYEGMFACGQNALHRSYLGNGNIRTPNVGFNVQSGFYAALLMLHKTTKFQYLPLERIAIGDKNLYYYGERGNNFDETIIEGDINSDQFICYYLRGGVVCGLLTYGYTNLHLYLIEAMKKLMMPTGPEINMMDSCHKYIVNMVLKNSSEFVCTKQYELQRKAEIMMVKGLDVKRYSKFRSQLSDNVKAKKKEEAEDRQMQKEMQDRKMKEEVEKSKLKFVEKKRDEAIKRMEGRL